LTIWNKIQIHKPNGFYLLKLLWKTYNFFFLLLLRVVFGWKERKREAKNKIRFFMKSMEIGSKKNMFINSFWGDVSLFIILKYIICFNVVVFSNFANIVKFKYFCLDTKSYNSAYINIFPHFWERHSMILFLLLVLSTNSFFDFVIDTF
jgi:hypothetical protein